ncbi:MAG TPA: GNAT family N-acetyltransferase [Acidimicrobiales bacterium]|jgi:ribosomal protein S18 acetylase RimI-like enzyme|nr:GNAT family N-acetyltransferase [Acidimicrobiales bacterium]
MLVASAPGVTVIADVDVDGDAAPAGWAVTVGWPVMRSPAADEHAIRSADGADADSIGQLLHDFNREFDEPTPTPSALADRVRLLLGAGDITILLGGTGPDGLAVLRYRAGLWSEALECSVAELYVVPDRRGHGLGRALMESAIDQARDHGADYMDLGTSEDDVVARKLYESLGFTNREKPPDGPIMYVYEREL